MSENVQSKPVKTTHRIRRVIFYVALLLVAFLLGFVPMWLKSCEYSSSLFYGTAFCVEPKTRINKGGIAMLWTIAVVLIILWLLGIVSSYTMGGFLLVIAVVVVLVNIIRGRKPL